MRERRVNERERVNEAAQQPMQDRHTLLGKNGSSYRQYVSRPINLIFKYYTLTYL